ncbi:Uma2 family endonuclease [Streptomyces griseoluteus]|uniref:Uma2 family endonuclease n=1 Tax=Streptomyces griseoluteus TaxID=29306 RepID=UPI0036BE6009
MVVASQSASKRYNRLALAPATALDGAAGTDSNADTDCDVCLQDAPLTDRRLDVIVCRAETVDVTPAPSERVLSVIKAVSPVSKTAARIVKVDQYAKAGAPFYRRVEQAATGVPIVHTYVLDPAPKAYKDGEMLTGVVKAAVPFPVAVSLGVI